jgi:organic hydroperoxide reductase OsmC/OhrA
VADRVHHYRVDLRWTGNSGAGTASYGGYGRDHVLSVPGQPAILGSSDPAFRGDAARWNPEQLLVASLSACHQLWYLHLCADAGVVVLAYADAAEGAMAEAADGVGQFTSVTLRPEVTVSAGSDAAAAIALHAAAAARCFIARSMAFPVRHEPVVSVAAG